ncbi:MAG: hypothetical protein ACTSUE_02190 [Promethearchaeota archaeon]
MGKSGKRGYIYSFDQSGWNDVLGAIAYGRGNGDEPCCPSDQLEAEMQALRVARFLLHEDRAWFRPRLPGWVLQMVESVPASYSVDCPNIPDWVLNIIKKKPEQYTINGNMVEEKDNWMAGTLRFRLPFSKPSQVRFPEEKYKYLESIFIQAYHPRPRANAIPGIGGPLIKNTSFIFNRVAAPETVKHITINRCGLERLESFGKFTNLRKLYVTGNPGLNHVDDIVGMDKLAEVRIEKSSLDNIEWFVPRAGTSGDVLPSLEKLSISSSEPFEIKPAEHLENLENLKILIICDHPGLRISGKNALAPNIEMVNFVNVNLQYIDPEAISKHRHLKSFGAGRTTSIPENIDEIVEALVELHYRFGTLHEFYPPMEPGGPESPVNTARFKPFIDAGFRWTFKYEHALMK